MHHVGDNYLYMYIERPSMEWRFAPREVPVLDVPGDGAAARGVAALAAPEVRGRGLLLLRGRRRAAVRGDSGLRVRGPRRPWHEGVLRGRPVVLGQALGLS